MKTHEFIEVLEESLDGRFVVHAGENYNITTVYGNNMLVLAGKDDTEVFTVEVNKINFDKQ